MDKWTIKPAGGRMKLKPTPLAPGLATMIPLPCEVIATSDELEVRGQFDYVDGRLGFTSIVARSLDGGHVTGERLRSFPVATVAREAALMLLLNVERHPGGGTQLSPLGSPPAGGGGRGPTDEQLAYVAELYRFSRAIGDPPTESVSKAFGISYPTATRWVGKAREAGHLNGEEA